jgi:SH3 domain-containing protein
MEVGLFPHMNVLLLLLAVLLPVDEAKRDPSFAAYRQELLAAVRQHDDAALAKLVDPKIRTGFGGEGGVADFRRQIKERKLWPELEWVVSHGGSWQGETFCAPYVYSKWPDAVDSFQGFAVTGKGVALRSSPKTGRIVTRLDYDVVTIAGAEQQGWRKVKTGSGKVGWVSTAYLRSPVGYRSCFGKTPNGWRMQLFVSGD